MFYMLASKRFKQKRNQMLHILDAAGRSYCQTENVKRRKLVEFLEVNDSGGHPVCKICSGIMAARKADAARAKTVKPRRRKRWTRTVRHRVDELTRQFRAIIGPP